MVRCWCNRICVILTRLSAAQDGQRLRLRQRLACDLQWDDLARVLWQFMPLLVPPCNVCLGAKSRRIHPCPVPGGRRIRPSAESQRRNEAVNGSCALSRLHLPRCSNKRPTPGLAADEYAYHHWRLHKRQLRLCPSTAAIVGLPSPTPLMTLRFAILQCATRHPYLRA